MKVDFYQLARLPAEQVIANLSEKVLAAEGRLIVVAEDENFLARLDRMLWDQGPTSFLPHGLSGGADDSRQPILLSASTDAPNLARNMLIVDDVWRDAALTYDRALYLFDGTNLKAARATWKALAAHDGVERRYSAREGGKSVEKG